MLVHFCKLEFCLWRCFLLFFFFFLLRCSFVASNDQIRYDTTSEGGGVSQTSPLLVFRKKNEKEWRIQQIKSDAVKLFFCPETYKAISKNNRIRVRRRKFSGCPISLLKNPGDVNTSYSLTHLSALDILHSYTSYSLTHSSALHILQR
jgi:hypothetical protein